MTTAKINVEEIGIEAVDLSSLSSPVCATLLIEFLKDLTEPLTLTLYHKFIETLEHPSENLQVAELKVLMRQLPELNRTVLIQVLKTLNEIEHYDAFNQTSRRMLASVFAPFLIWDPVDGECEFTSSFMNERAKLVQLMLLHCANLAEASTSLRARASRAGIAPEAVNAPVSATNSSAVLTGPNSSVRLTGRNQTATAASGRDDSELREMVGALPGMLDEGLAAVRQLTESNEALQTLAEHVAESLESIQEVSKDLEDVRGRLQELEQRHQDVEDKLSEDASSVARGAMLSNQDAVASLEHKMETMIEAVQTRLDNIESAHHDDEDSQNGGALSHREVETLIQAALDEARTSSQQEQQAERKAFQKQLLEDFELWKNDVMQEAARACAEQVKGAQLQISQLQARLDASDAGGQKGGLSAEGDISTLKKRMDEAVLSEERLNVRVDDLLHSVEGCLETCKRLEGEMETNSERANKAQEYIDTLLAGHEAREADGPTLRDLRAKVEALALSKQNVDGGKPAEGAEGASVALREAMEHKLDGLALQVSKIRDLKDEGSRMCGALEGLENWRGQSATEIQALQERVDLLEQEQRDALAELSSAQQAWSMAERNHPPLQSEGGGRAPGESAESMEEAFGSMFAEHVSPEISSLREAVHVLQTLVGKGSGATGENEEGSHGKSGGAKSIVDQLEEVQDQLSHVPPSSWLDDLGERLERAEESITVLQAASTHPPDAEHDAAVVEQLSQQVPTASIVSYARPVAFIASQRGPVASVASSYRHAPQPLPKCGCRISCALVHHQQYRPCQIAGVKYGCPCLLSVAPSWSKRGCRISSIVDRSTRCTQTLCADAMDSA